MLVKDSTKNSTVGSFLWIFLIITVPGMSQSESTAPQSQKPVETEGDAIQTEPQPIGSSDIPQLSEQAIILLSEIRSKIKPKKDVETTISQEG